MIIVCPFSAVHPLVAQHKVGHVVSLLAPETEHPTIVGIDQRRHLRLSFHDIVEEMEGLVTPRPGDTEKLIGFFEGWDRADPMLIHGPRLDAGLWMLVLHQSELLRQFF